MISMQRSDAQHECMLRDSKSARHSTSAQSVLHNLRAELQGLRVEVHNLRAELQGLRVEVQNLRAELQGLRGKIQNLRAVLHEM